MLVDTHAHLHHPGVVERLDAVMEAAAAADVGRMVTVGCNADDSVAAIAMANRYDNVFATVGLHPHEADTLNQSQVRLSELATGSKVVAIGECGLDYFRSATQPAEQAAAFKFQIELAMQHSLPMVWHVRDAFDDFFAIVDQYPGVRGIVHCFTGSEDSMKKATDRGFLIALNGIMTFSKDPEQRKAAQAVPLEYLVLETDCPFLAPVPMRGRPNEPAFITITAEFLSNLRGESVEDLARATSQNAINLLGLKNV